MSLEWREKCPYNPASVGSQKETQREERRKKNPNDFAVCQKEDERDFRQSEREVFLESLHLIQNGTGKKKRRKNEHFSRKRKEDGRFSKNLKRKKLEIFARKLKKKDIKIQRKIRKKNRKNIEENRK